MKTINYYLIDTAGQLTAVIANMSQSKDKLVSSKNLLAQYPTMGQVAYVNIDAPMPSVEMMGGELSINGSIAAAFYCSNRLDKQTFNLRTSPLSIPTSVQRISNSVRISLSDSIVEAVTDIEVAFTGIKYRLIKSEQESNKQNARKFCGDNLAAGFIVEEKPGEIIPIVYVQATDTLVTETACGSASLAYSLLTGYQTIVQPSGSIITISRPSGKLSISTQCKEVGYASISNS